MHLAYQDQKTSLVATLDTLRDESRNLEYLDRYPTFPQLELLLFLELERHR